VAPRGDRERRFTAIRSLAAGGISATDRVARRLAERNAQPKAVERQSAAIDMTSTDTSSRPNRTTTSAVNTSLTGDDRRGSSRLLTGQYVAAFS